MALPSIRASGEVSFLGLSSGLEPCPWCASTSTVTASAVVVINAQHSSTGRVVQSHACRSCAYEWRPPW